MSTKRQEQLRCEAAGIEFIDNTLPAEPGDESTHYVKNADLRAAIIESKANGELTNEAVNMLESLARKLSNKLKFTNPDDKDDVISTAMLDFVRYYNRYDPSVSENCFAYFTSVATNAFAKAYRQLGKKKCPDSMTVSLSKNIYSI